MCYLLVLFLLASKLTFEKLRKWIFGQGSSRVHAALPFIVLIQKLFFKKEINCQVICQNHGF